MTNRGFYARKHEMQWPTSALGAETAETTEAENRLRSDRSAREHARRENAARQLRAVGLKTASCGRGMRQRDTGVPCLLLWSASAPTYVTSWFRPWARAALLSMSESAASVSDNATACQAAHRGMLTDPLAETRTRFVRRTRCFACRR